MIEKIQKILSNLGYGSRRYIENMIKNGSIFINKKKAVIGQYLDENNPGDIFINTKKVVLKKNKKKMIIYNKPIGEICTKNDPIKRMTVFDKLPILNVDRWVSVGRLDINTKGLLLFTNDGNLANKLMHPSNHIEREYYVRVFGNINQDTMNVLKKGVKIKSGYSSFKSIHALNFNNKKKNKWFKVILCGGKNREIRLMFKTVKCEVNQLIRVRYGNIILPKNLKTGKWMILDKIHLKNLYNLFTL